MALAVETKGAYSIPIADTDTELQQTCEIPVIYTELQIPNSTTRYTYLRFTIIPGERSPLDILAGGENLEIAGQRIKTQMIQRLEAALAASQKPHFPLNTNLQIQRLSRYFECTLPECK